VSECARDHEPVYLYMHGTVKHFFSQILFIYTTYLMFNLIRIA